MADVKGQFMEMLTRNNKQIREDRAAGIVDDHELKYRRVIEDIETEMKRLIRMRENMLDMSPDNALNLKPAVELDPQKFVDTDIEIGVKLRNLEIKLEIAKTRYEKLFGKGE